jgi:hypothetical protein
MIVQYALRLSEIHLRFEYGLPKRAVYDWWTDLSGTGYVGNALKSIKAVGRDGDKILVETRWVIMGRTKKLLERLTPISEDHWVWQPTIFGIEIMDDFRLQSRGGKTVLTIDSKATPRGMKGKLAQMVFGGMLDRMMVDEWKSASEALVSEMGSTTTHGA